MWISLYQRLRLEGLLALSGLVLVVLLRKGRRAWFDTIFVRCIRRRSFGTNAVCTLKACAKELRACGVATLEVSAETEALHASCFAAARVGLKVAADDESPLAIRADVDSAHASGVHAAGALSQYNVCREGIIFSDGDDAYAHSISPDFARSMALFFESAVSLAGQVFAVLESDLAIPHGWFEQAFGPIRNHSQWHCKRYRPELAPAAATCPTGRRVLLPIHSDPSLISSTHALSHLPNSPIASPLRCSASE